MKRFVLILLLHLPVFIHASTYFVSPSGNDSNPGTLSSPFLTWEKGVSVLSAGDILYIRGGTYRSGYADSSGFHCDIENLTGTSASPIKIWAYPGEHPVFNLDNKVLTANTCIFYVSNCSYVHFKGLRFTGAPQNASGFGGYATQFWNSSNLTIENCEADHCVEGFNNAGSSELLFLNCDAHHLADPYSGYGGSNGFSSTRQPELVTNITYRGCRAWWCSDDGFDTFASEGTYIFENCWSFWNGYIPGTFTKAGDGQGFKLGPTSANQSNSLRRIVRNCTAFQNRAMGFDQNVGNCEYQLYNNTAYANGTIGFAFHYFNTKKTIRNNISYANGTAISSDAGWIQDHNSWNGLTVKDIDFVSLDSMGTNGLRQSDGSLPHLNFLHLASTSKMINAGVNTGLPFEGLAPDLGAFQYERTKKGFPVKSIFFLAAPPVIAFLIWLFLKNKKSRSHLIHKV